MNFFRDFIIYLGYFILFINCILFVSKYKKNGIAYKLFTVYSFAMLAVQLGSFFYTFYKKDNLFLSHYYFILQFFILSFFFLQLFKEKSQKILVKIVLIICTIILITQYCLKPNLYYEFNLLEIFITSFPLIIYSALHLYNLLYNKKTFYYTSLGILIYLMGSTVIFFAGNISVKLLPKSFFLIVWNLNIYLYLFYQLIIMYDWKINFSATFIQKNNTQ